MCCGEQSLKVIKFWRHLTFDLEGWELFSYFLNKKLVYNV